MTIVAQNTVILADGLSADGTTASQPVQGGQYFFAVGGDLGGGTVDLLVSIGNTLAPVTGSAVTAEGTVIVWLPRCTVQTRVAGSTDPNINAALSELSTRLERV